MDDTKVSKKEQYNRSYYLKHKNDWYEQQTCDVCDGHYCRATKYNHLKSKKHIYAEKDKQIKKLLDQINATKLVQN